MSNTFASGKRAISTCDRCGQVFLLKELRKVTIKLKLTSIKVCRECFEPDHPQYLVGMTPVFDPQALREPRPDQSLHQIRAIPVVLNIGVGAASFVGNVSVYLQTKVIVAGVASNAVLGSVSEVAAANVAVAGVGVAASVGNVSITIV